MAEEDFLLYSFHSKLELEGTVDCLGEDDSFVSPVPLGSDSFGNGLVALPRGGIGDSVFGRLGGVLSESPLTPHRHLMN